MFDYIGPAPLTVLLLCKLSSELVIQTKPVVDLSTKLFCYLLPSVSFNGWHFKWKYIFISVCVLQLDLQNWKEEPVIGKFCINRHRYAIAGTYTYPLLVYLSSSKTLKARTCWGESRIDVPMQYRALPIPWGFLEPCNNLQRHIYCVTTTPQSVFSKMTSFMDAHCQELSQQCAAVNEDVLLKIDLWCAS